ncbi:hypothetical protein LTR28_011773, partial [Elasticomyces elasticus]
MGMVWLLPARTPPPNRPLDADAEPDGSGDDEEGNQQLRQHPLLLAPALHEAAAVAARAGSASAPLEQLLLLE